jgi:hypothetical protein
VDAKLAANLGLQGLGPAQGKVVASLWLAQPVAPCEAALIGLQIPLIEKSRSVEMMGTAPPDKRLHRVMRGVECCRAAVDKYMVRPPGLPEDLTVYRWVGGGPAAGA